MYATSSSAAGARAIRTPRPATCITDLDNWIYGIVGYSGFGGNGGDVAAFPQGFYRFKPDGSNLEFLRNTSNNSWGVGLSEEGILFGSTANGNPSVYMPIPNRYYEAVRGWPAMGSLPMIAESNDFYPDHRQSAAGRLSRRIHRRRRARTLHGPHVPREYWNSTAFVTEPTGHLVATFVLQPHGANFADKYDWNLLASDDEWTAPIAAEVGPDGNVWVIDWYNYIVQHNPTPHGFKTGKGNAYETPLRDKTHGRIYRVVYNAAKPAAADFAQGCRCGHAGQHFEKPHHAVAHACAAAAGRTWPGRCRARINQIGRRSKRRRNRFERRRDSRHRHACRFKLATKLPHREGECGHRAGARTSFRRRRAGGLAKSAVDGRIGQHDCRFRFVAR